MIKPTTNIEEEITLPYEEKLKCYKTELQSVNYLSYEELFQGFDNIKAITFSYDLSFINKILQYFKQGQIILGANYLVQKDTKLTNFLVDVLTNSHEATKAISSYESLVTKLQSGEVEFRTPTFAFDHRKVYLLRSEEKTRVVIASANMSTGAWNGNHMEFYQYDDSPLCYEEFEKDFETAWVDSQEIPYNIVVAKDLDNPIDGNPIIKKVKKVDKVILLQPKTEEPQIIENIKYVIDHEKIKEEYKGLVSDIKLKSKNGLIEIVPKIVETIEHNYKKIQQTYKVKNITEDYPEMTIDYANEKAFLNNEEINLSPFKEEVQNDIANFVGIFDNFNQFIGDVERLKDSHFKMANAIFASPFHAKIRCASKIRGIETSSLPLYLLVASSTANCGKTFMISALLKMMTGKALTPFNKASYKKDSIIEMQFANKGVPVFIDELDSKSFSYIKDLIKNPERCEDNQIETMPMLIFASNNILEPDEIFRKRMVFLRLNGRLPSHIDQSAYKSMGNALIRKFGTGLYREYLRRMINKVSKELDYIITGKEIPDDYYPDLMKLSSETLVEIFNDFGFKLPNYVRPLTWNNDYSINAKFISEDAISAIENLYKKNKNAFTFNKNTITIEIGVSSDTKKKVESWVNTLPSEMKAEAIYLRDCIKISLDKKEYEKRIGYKLGGLLSRFF